MLSSANKSGPTIKQFIQPYFIEIAPDGAIISFCARFNAFLQKKGLGEIYPGQHIFQVFSELGHSHPALSGDFSKDCFSKLIDLSFHQNGNKPVTIRWTLTPLSGTHEQPASWQLTGLRVHSANSPFDVNSTPEMLLALEKKVLELNSDPNASLPAIVDHFLEGLGKIFRGMYCSVLTLNEDNTVKHLSAPGLPTEFSSFIDGRPIGPQAGSCGTAMFLKERIIVSDIATDPLWARARDFALQFGLRACWSLPVMNSKGEVLAAFATYYRTQKSPTDKELEIVERAANLLKIILENKRAEEEIKFSHERYKIAAEALLKQELDKQKLVAQAMVDAQERERAEIGKELHDNINQILSTTKLYLELAKSNSEERLSLINRSAVNIQEAIQEIRNISRSLVPSSIGDLGLLDSVNDLVESIKATGIIHVEFYAAGGFDERLSDKEKLMLFRIIQEQINNVLRHSGAANLIIELILEERDNSIELNITDDGKGFNPESLKNKKGLGLSNIMSRAGLFGGKVTLLSAPDKGCTLRVQVPI